MTRYPTRHEIREPRPTYGPRFTYCIGNPAGAMRANIESGRAEAAAVAHLNDPHHRPAGAWVDAGDLDDCAEWKEAS